MIPRITDIPGFTLMGRRMVMSLTENRTGMLWSSFMPRRHEISHALTTDLISLQIYPSTYFSDFDLAREFEKWAAIEVPDFDQVPDGMETLQVPGGLYAVFMYTGSGNDPAVFEYIYRTWLPDSGYDLDDRPHFEVLGEKYKNNDPASEEEIWIPVRPQ